MGGAQLGVDAWNQSDAADRMLHVTAEIGEVSDALISLQKAASDREAAPHVAGRPSRTHIELAHLTAIAAMVQKGDDHRAV